MKRRRLLLNLVLAALLFFVGLAAPQATGTPCSACAGVGRIPCPEHRAAEVARESNTLLCSYYAGCPKCAGRGTLDCGSCALPINDASIALDQLRTATVKRFAEYQKAIGRPLQGAASAHFNLVCELDAAKVDGKRRNRHELTHLYLDRLEEVYRTYVTFFGLTDADITARSEFFLWTTKEDHEKAGQDFCGYKTPDVEYKRGVEAITSLWFDAKKMKDDAALHRNVVHQAVHGIMNVQSPVAWTGKLRMGWADEGLSLWFEDHMLGAATGYCFWPEEEPLGMRGGVLRPALKKLLEPDKPLDFEPFLELDTVDMTREQQTLGFALIDHLAAKDPLLLNRLLARLRAHTPSRDAFKEVYGLSLEQLEANWRAWVAETYPGH